MQRRPARFATRRLEADKFAQVLRSINSNRHRCIPYGHDCEEPPAAKNVAAFSCSSAQFSNRQNTQM